MVRTGLPEDVRDRIEEAFELANPDVDVRFSVNDDASTRAELAEEGVPAFDVWWGGSSTSMERLVREGRIAGWTPWAGSPFVFVFDRDRVSLANAPVDWIDVLHHGWADDILVPDPTRSEAGAAFVLGAIAEAARTEGDPYYGTEWLVRVDHQVLRYVADEEEAIRGVRMGSASLAIVSLAAFAAWSGDDETLHHRRPESRAAYLPRGVALVSGGGAKADAGVRFVSFVTAAADAGDAGLVAGEPEGWELPGENQREDAVMVADSSGVWLARWRETVRGRGK